MSPIFETKEEAYERGFKEGHEDKSGLIGILDDVLSPISALTESGQAYNTGREDGIQHNLQNKKY